MCAPLQPKMSLVCHQPSQWRTTTTPTGSRSTTGRAGPTDKLHWQSRLLTTMCQDHKGLLLGLGVCQARRSGSIQQTSLSVRLRICYTFNSFSSARCVLFIGSDAVGLVTWRLSGRKNSASTLKQVMFWETQLIWSVLAELTMKTKTKSMIWRDNTHGKGG